MISYLQKHPIITAHPDYPALKLQLPAPYTDREPLTLTNIVWNIEGYKRNALKLKELVDSNDYDLIFLQEPMIFQSDYDLVNNPIGHKYSFCLSSDDKYDDNIVPLTSSRAHGGVLTKWKKYSL